MARWVALALGVVLVGVLLTGMPWQVDAQTDDDRIADLEARVADLETRRWSQPLLVCTQGEITGALEIVDWGGYYDATIRWMPKTTPDNVNNPLLNRGVGEAVFRDCT